MMQLTGTSAPHGGEDVSIRVLLNQRAQMFGMRKRGVNAG